MRFNLTVIFQNVSPLSYFMVTLLSYSFMFSCSLLIFYRLIRVRVQHEDDGCMILCCYCRRRATKDEAVVFTSLWFGLNSIRLTSLEIYVSLRLKTKTWISNEVSRMEFKPNQSDVNTTASSSIALLLSHDMYYNKKGYNICRNHNLHIQILHLVTFVHDRNHIHVRDMIWVYESLKIKRTLSSSIIFPWWSMRRKRFPKRTN